jgi:methylamine dehydrogenase accessory protein MauD
LTVVVVLARLGLVAVFGLAAIGKLADRHGAREAVVRFGVPRALVNPVALGLPVVELLIAGGLLVTASVTWAAAAAIAMLTIFCVAIVRLLARGEAPDCHCFGGLGSAPVGRGTLVRNLALAGLAGFVAVEGRGRGGESISRFLADLGAVAIVLGVATALHAAFSWQLFGQNGRLLQRVAVLEASLGLSADEGSTRPAIGDPAPSFALPDLDGEIVTLETLLSPGHGALLVFTDPGCTHCNPLLPALGRERGEHDPKLVVISRGSQVENRAKAAEHGISLVLMQEDYEVAQAYGNHGLPSAILVDAAGRIASAPAGGARAVSELLQARPEASASVVSIGPYDPHVYAEADSA